MKKLDHREKIFVKEYPKDLSARAAAMRAGYAKTTANSKAWLWVSESVEDVPEHKRHVWHAVQKELEKRSERVKVKADDVLKLSYEAASFDPLVIYNEDGTIKPLSDWPVEARRCVAEIRTKQISIGKGEEKKAAELIGVKLVDRMKALKLTGDHIGVQAFKQVIEHQDGGLSDRLAAARKRLESRDDE